ncbi:uncharacterized protein MYCGRDRAFT_39186 [Zymoseptoria tritici IPO323]|nr:uncharacterized protein MYCGRDRAFT_39186 [Zymoseptoria tritici IPO323]EGP89223.1 hypothetical protein MYCGRDRAFT_39186 [Zymoseptoria tritici IPO323]
MIHYFYFLDYEVGKRGAGLETPAVAADLVSEDDHALAHAKIFAVAEKYQVPGLKELAVGKFKAAMEVHEKHPDFAEVVTTVFATTPETVRDLRDIVSTRLTTNPNLLDSKDIESAVNSVSGLTFELLRQAHKATAALKMSRTNWGPPTTCYRCLRFAKRCGTCK